MSKDYPPGLNRMDDYIGRKVRLTRDLKTQGGTKFVAGEVLEVCGHWRGRLTLERHCGLSGSRRISAVSRASVNLVEGGVHDPV